MNEDRNATRRFTRYVNKRRRLAAAHLAGEHKGQTVQDCPGCEGIDLTQLLPTDYGFTTESN